MIIKETTRLSNLLDGMLGGNQPAHWVTHNIHAVLEHMTQVLSGQLLEAVRLQKDYDPSLPEFIMDFDRLVQIFLNLARNAIDAIHGTGKLTIRTRIVHKMTLGNQLHPLVVAVEVCDTGDGIPRFAVRIASTATCTANNRNGRLANAFTFVCTELFAARKVGVEY